MKILFHSNRYFDSGTLAEFIIMNIGVLLEENNEPRITRIMETYVMKGYVASVIDLIRSQIDTIVSN